MLGLESIDEMAHYEPSCARVYSPPGKPIRSPGVTVGLKIGLWWDGSFCDCLSYSDAPSSALLTDFYRSILFSIRAEGLRDDITERLSLKPRIFP